MNEINPYDDLPYKSYPIEWTAPERLALASLLHGGPRPSLQGYRMLELGCGDGCNLLPLACYRKHAEFVGIDAAGGRIALARARCAALGLTNLTLIEADIRCVQARLGGPFDYIVAHGVFSWVDDATRDALLGLFAEHLRPGGLLYLNYNTQPGWKVRGMVRNYLLELTSGAVSLAARARQAQQCAGRVVAALAPGPHPYVHLIRNEFSFVCESDVSYVAHEYLAAHNRAYWRSEFLALAQVYGLEAVADADFSYPSGRTEDEFPQRLLDAGLALASIEDTQDLLCYRQLHSPILTKSPLKRRPPGRQEIAHLFMASCLTPRGNASALFDHPSGYEVEAKEAVVDVALRRVQPLWPAGLRLVDLFPDVAHVFDDLVLLHRNGLIELRCAGTQAACLYDAELNRLELEWGGYRTSRHHRCETVDVAGR